MENYAIPMVKAAIRGVETQQWPPDAASKNVATASGPQHFSMEFPRCSSNTPSIVISATPQYSDRQKSNAATSVTFLGSMDQNMLNCAFMETRGWTQGLPPTTAGLQMLCCESFLTTGNERCSLSMDGMDGRNTHPFGSQGKHRSPIGMDKKGKKALK